MAKPLSCAKITYPLILSEAR